jgi:hypothetical protein
MVGATLLAVGSLALSAVAPVLTISADMPSEKITINVATVLGTGCPAGTAAVAVSPDNTAFTVSYSQYVAEVGPGVAATAARKNCQINLKVNVPQGFTYAIVKTDYRGYINLAKGATGVERASYYFQGMSATGAIQHNMVGPMDGNWQFTDEVGIAAMIWHPCGEQRNLNINTELRVAKGSSGTASSFAVMDSTDGSLATIYHFGWRRC